MPSLWKAETEPFQSAPLTKDAQWDILVVGSGIAGPSSAYEAARCGVSRAQFDEPAERSPQDAE